MVTLTSISAGPIDASNDFGGGGGVVLLAVVVVVEVVEEVKRGRYRRGIFGSPELKHS